MHSDHDLRNRIQRKIVPFGEAGTKRTLLYQSGLPCRVEWAGGCVGQGRSAKQGWMGAGSSSTWMSGKLVATHCANSCVRRPTKYANDGCVSCASPWPLNHNGLHVNAICNIAKHNLQHEEALGRPIPPKNNWTDKGHDD